MNSEVVRALFRQNLGDTLKENNDNGHCDQNVVIIADTTLWENAAVASAKQGKAGQETNTVRLFRIFIENGAMVDRVIQHARNCVNNGARVAGTYEHLEGAPKATNTVHLTYLFIFVLVFNKSLVKCYDEFNSDWAVSFLFTIGLHALYNTYNKYTESHAE